MEMGSKSFHGGLRSDLLVSLSVCTERCTSAVTDLCVFAGGGGGLGAKKDRDGGGGWWACMHVCVRVCNWIIVTLLI